MTAQDKAVTYFGKEDPFVDRIYHSNLTFTPGQTRAVPVALAARFLLHSDVFKEGDAAAKNVKEKAVEAPADKKAEGDTHKDDTAVLLAEANKEQDKQREQDNARFELLESLESMDAKALRDFALTNYKQKINGTLGEAKVRDQVRGFIDQYGLP